MAFSTDDDTEQRQRLLDEWVQTRREIAALEARAADLLMARLRLMDADVSESPFHRDAIHRSMVAEYSAAGRVSTGTVEYAFSDARIVDDSHPSVREAFRLGLITASHVREIVRAGTGVREAVHRGRVDEETLTVYDAAALVVAEHETPARTRTRVRQIAAALAEESLVEHHRRAADERTVTVRPVGDGLALLTAVLPEHLAVAIHDRLTRLAHQVITTRAEREDAPHATPTRERDPLDDPSCSLAADEYAIFGADDTFTTDPTRMSDFTLESLSVVRSEFSRTPGATGESMSDHATAARTSSADVVEDAGFAEAASDTRTIDQVRSDLLTDLLLASDPTQAHGTGLDNIQARIQVTVSAATLAGADDRIAELDGHGPLHPDVARDLASRNSGWTRLFLDPTGLVTETDTYSPTEPMRRLLRARDQHCRFPGCRTPVHRCQIDHNHDHAKGGRTSIDNLSHFCLRHHSLKHPGIGERHRWTARSLPDGTIRWISPHGRAYLDPPPRRVMFV